MSTPAEKTIVCVGEIQCTPATEGEPMPGSPFESLERERMAELAAASVARSVDQAVRGTAADRADQALRLLSAWTAGKPVEADDFMVQRAVDVVDDVHRMTREKLG